MKREVAVGESSGYSSSNNSSGNEDDDFVLPWSKLIFIDGAPYVECFLNPDIPW